VKAGRGSTFFKKGEAPNLRLLKKLYKTTEDPKKYIGASPLHYGNLFYQFNLATVFISIYTLYIEKLEPRSLSKPLASFVKEEEKYLLPV